MSEEELDPVRENAKRIATEHLNRGDATGWFDALYAEAGGDHERVPWADLEPNRFFREWAEATDLAGNGRTAMVVGCGLGDEAKYLDGLGFQVTAFDISEKAIEWAKKIHAESGIEFHVADLFDLPEDWKGKFEFVLEVYTIQALPMSLRTQSTVAIASLVSSGGELVIVEWHRENGEEPEALPWPLSPNDLSRFEALGFKKVSRDEYFGDEEEPIKRFVVKYTFDD